MSVGCRKKCYTCTCSTLAVPVFKFRDRVYLVPSTEIAVTMHHGCPCSCCCRCRCRCCYRCCCCCCCCCRCRCCCCCRGCLSPSEKCWCQQYWKSDSFDNPAKTRFNDHPVQDTPPMQQTNIVSNMTIIYFFLLDTMSPKDGREDFSGSGNLIKVTREINRFCLQTQREESRQNPNILLNGGKETETS